MEKLELKHLAIAFSNNYKVLYYDDERCCNQICKIVSLQEDTLTIVSKDYQYDYVSFNDVRLILFPISDLTKEIEVNGKLFYPIEVIGKMIDEEYVGMAEDKDGVIIGKDIIPGCGHPYDCDCMCYTYNLFYKDYNFYSRIYQDGNPDDLVDEITHESYLLIQKLFEWHFDVFGLIEKGLAIDINTL